ncbi:uncharacterized protein LOC144664250 [Oculina patagonica]
MIKKAVLLLLMVGPVLTLGALIADGCSNFIELNETDRAADAQGAKGCDRTLDFSLWYRFTSAAGTRMPTSVVPSNRCGTEAPGWLSGQHPTKEDGVVQRKVCFHWKNNPCNWNADVSVVNCGSFYVYKFTIPPFCYLRFCGNKGHNDANHCVPQPCQNGGICSDMANNGYSCICSPGFSGPNCSIDIDECADNPCQHGGNCTDGVNHYNCSCVPGYTGKNCSIDINECADNPCQHGGNCTDWVNHYNCSCVPGYTGKNCSIDIDECADNPCQHGGNCTDGVNHYNCSCVPGYTGKNCSIGKI